MIYFVLTLLISILILEYFIIKNKNKKSEEKRKKRIEEIKNNKILRDKLDYINYYDNDNHQYNDDYLKNLKK